MDQPPVVEIYYQTSGKIEVTIFLERETGRSQTPDMNADIITQFYSENRAFGSEGTLRVFLAHVLEWSYATRFLFTRLAASCTRPES